jgi:outer membrane receptor protein involved in Fe transport
MQYGYEPGSFTETKNNLNATRINVKLDWNPSEKNKLSLSYRYNNAERITAQKPNSGTFIRLSNSQYKLIAETHTASLEWKTFFNPKINNRLLFTYTHHVDDRDVVGRPFPQIQIFDDRASIIAGSNGSAQLNLFKGADLNLFDVIKFVANKQVISTGIDFNFSKLNNIAIGSHFGNYVFGSFNDFFNAGSPIHFTRGVSLVDVPKDDNTKGGARYNTRRLGFFISDDIQVNDRLKFTAGLRLDGNVLPQSFKTDSFFNTYAKPEIEKYYDLEGAQPGQLMNTHWQLSPRIAFNYKIPAERLTIRGGAGLFTGHILNLWANEFYNVNTFTIDIVPQLYNLRFNPDPYNQPGLSLPGTNPVAGIGTISIVSKHFKYPVVFKTSLSADKQLNNGWNFSTELLFTKNIHEHTYINVNLLPSKQAIGIA